MTAFPYPRWRRYKPDKKPFIPNGGAPNPINLTAPNDFSLFEEFMTINNSHSSDVESHRSDSDYEHTLAMNPERVLLQAIVERAIIDAYAPAMVDKPKDPSKYTPKYRRKQPARNIPKDAEDWLLDTESTDPFSFGWCIQHLGFSNSFVKIAQRASYDHEFRAKIATIRITYRKASGHYHYNPSVQAL